MHTRPLRHAFGMLAILLVSLVVVPALPAHAAPPPGWTLVTPADLPNLTSVTFQSRANGKMVSTERTYPGADAGMLRARATAIGAWEQFVITPEQLLPVERFSPTTVIQSRSGSLEYAYADNVGRLLHGRQRDPAIFTGTVWTDRSEGKAFTGQPALASYADGRVQLIGHNISSDVWVRTQTALDSPDWTAWSALGGAMASRATVGRLPDATLAVFAVDNLGQLWNLQQNGANGPYLNWRNLGAAGLAGPPAVVTIRDGVQLFAVDTGGTVKTAVYRNSALTAWTSLGGSGFSGTPAVVALPGFILRVFARGGDGTVATKQQDGTGAWPAAWTPLSGLAAAGPPAAVLDPGSGRIEVVARTADGHYSRASETEQGSGAWGPWVEIVDQFGSPLVAATDPSAVTYNDCKDTWGFAVRTSDQQSLFLTARAPGCPFGVSAESSEPGQRGLLKEVLPSPPSP